MHYCNQIFCIFFINICVCIFSLNIEELKPLNYDVDILQIPIRKEDVQSRTTISMTSKYGQQYQCILPQIEEEEVFEKETVAEKDTDIKELLKSMKAGQCLLKGKDWWTYEFCFGHYIKQFHIEDGQILGPVITLGLYESDYDWNNETDQDKFKHVKQRYHSQFYVNGTKCDLTGQPRTAEVRLFCEEDAGDYIHRVDEPGTCSYVITIHTSRLCAHPKLRPLPSKKAHSIPCHPVLTEEQYAKYLIKLNEEKELAEKKRKQFLKDQQELLKAMKRDEAQDAENKKNAESNTETSQSVETPDSGDPVKRGDPQLKTEEEKDSSKSPEDVKQVPTSTENDVDSDELTAKIRKLGLKTTESKIGNLYEITSDGTQLEQTVKEQLEQAVKEQLEQAVEDKLEKAGLDIGGRKIEVKIITAGFGGNEEGKEFQMAAEENPIEFENIIMALLTGQQEAVLEANRRKKLEKNYKFTWEDDEE